MTLAAAARRTRDAPHVAPPSDDDAPATAMKDGVATAVTAMAEARDAGFRPIADEVRELERARMIAALQATGGVQNRAAALIEMPLRTFVTKVKRYAIAPSEWGGT